MEDILIIYPQFSSKFESYFKDFNHLTYDESKLLRSNILLKTLQGFFYIIDLFLPRKYATSSLFRLCRNKNCESFWINFFETNKFKIENVKRVFIIKGYGITPNAIPQFAAKKIKIILWDSLARYKHVSGVEKYYIATTSPYDSLRYNLKLISFFAEDSNMEVKKIDCSTKNSFFYVGRFTITRFLFLLYINLMLDKSKKLRAILSPAPFSFKMGEISVIKHYHSELKYPAEIELVVNDLNEDSPSLRIDSEENQPLVVVNNLLAKSMFRNRNIYNFKFSFKKFSLITQEATVKCNLSVISFHTLLEK